MPNIKHYLLSGTIVACLPLACADFARAEPTGGNQAEDKTAGANDSIVVPPDVPAQQQIRQLIRQLNDDKFAVRQSASRQLVELGEKVIPDLVLAAQGQHLEVTSRALDLLKELLHSNNPDSQAAARKALQQLASTDHETASSGAKKILEDSQPQEIGPFGQVFPNGRFPLPAARILQAQQQAQIQVQVQGGFGGQIIQRKIQLRKANGVTTIEVSDGDKEIKIVEDQQNGIKLEATEGKGDQRQTKKYTAKNAEELKKNHPEAHQLYQKYTQNNGVPVIFGQPNQGLRVQIGPAIIGNVEPAKPEKHAADRQAEAERPQQQDSKSGDGKAGDGANEPAD